MTNRPDNVIPITPDARFVAEKFSAEYDRELLTILFTDLVGSTQLQNDLGNSESTRITELHRKLVRDELARYDAREISWAGDSCLAVFTKPSDAVLFALRMQTKHGKTRKSEPLLPEVRVGIHIGEIVVRHGVQNEDIFGLQVSETARIMSVARGGQVYCSRAVFDSARGSLRGDSIEGIGEPLWARHGLYLLKGSDDPVEICEIGDGAAAMAHPPEPNEKCRPVDSKRTQAALTSRAAIALVIVAVALGSWWFGRGASQPESARSGAIENEAVMGTVEPIRVRRFAMSLPNDQPLAPPAPLDGPLALSPDGELLAYNSWFEGKLRLMLRRMDELEGHPIPDINNVNRPFFSPDGNWIGFVGNYRGKRKLLKAPVAGGDAVPLADVALGFPSDWSEQGYIVYTPSFGSGLMRVSESGGDPEAFTELSEGEMGHSFPEVLPGGRAVLYTAFTTPTIESARLVLFNLETREKSVLAEGAGGGKYVSSGHIVFSKLGSLSAMPFDLETLKVTGPAFDVTQVRMAAPDEPASRWAISASGKLAYAPTDLNPADAVSLVWVSREGKEETVNVPPGDYWGIDISPDGQWAAVTAQNATTADIWKLDLDRSAFARLTFDASVDMQAIVTPDSNHVVFLSIRTGAAWNLYRKAVDGSGEAELLSEGGTAQRFPSEISSDGSELIYRVHEESSIDIMLVPLDGSGPARSLLNTRYNEQGGRLSPDGRWLAYWSNESGRDEVYVRSYPDLGSKMLISINGGTEPRWSADGRELFYKEKRTRMMLVTVEPGPELDPSPPELLFEGNYFDYDVHPDGDSFLMVKGVGDETLRVGGTELIVVENFPEEILSRQPSKAN